MFAFVLAQRDQAPPPRKPELDAGGLGWRWRWPCSAKGLIGLVLPGASLVLYIAVAARFGAVAAAASAARAWRCCFAVTAPWFVAVSLANPEFARFFFIHEHFERFLTKVHGRYQPMWYFVPILLIGMLPWLVGFFSAPAAGGAARPQTSASSRAASCCCWVVVVFCFFSAVRAPSWPPTSCRCFRRWRR